MTEENKTKRQLQAEQTKLKLFNAAVELLAQAAEGLSVNIHASIDGVVEQVTGTGATIRRKE